MNQANYATLEASQRLVTAGIVLETEVVWNYWLPWQYILVLEKDRTCAKENCIPAPSIAEIWRELPEEYEDYYLRLTKEGNAHYTGYYNGERLCSVIYSVSSTSPADALIDLLIWVRREKT